MQSDVGVVRVERVRVRVVRGWVSGGCEHAKHLHFRS